MADLNTIDLESFTKGRLPRNDYETKRVLGAAQTKVRSYCHWHVSPIRTRETWTLDGPGEWGGWTTGSGSYAGAPYSASGGLRRVRAGGMTLMLPTKRLQSIESLVEDGVALDVSTLQFDRMGNVTKTTGQRWSTNMGSIVATFTHGWSEDEAADWRQTVLMLADRMSLVRGLVGPFELSIGPYRTGSASEPFKDLFDEIDTDRYVRMPI